MTPQLFTTYATQLYGPNWTGGMANDLGLPKTTIGAWAEGDVPVPTHIFKLLITVVYLTRIARQPGNAEGRSLLREAYPELAKHAFPKR